MPEPQQVYLKTVLLQIRNVQLLYVTSRWRQIDFERRVRDMLIIELHGNKIFT